MDNSHESHEGTLRATVLPNKFMNTDKQLQRSFDLSHQPPPRMVNALAKIREDVNIELR